MIVRRPGAWLRTRAGGTVALVAAALLVVGGLWGVFRLVGERDGAAVPAPQEMAEPEPGGEVDRDVETGHPMPVPQPADSVDEGSAVDTLPDGEHFGFVSSFTGETLTLSPATFLTGDEASAAAREDGVIRPGEDLPNPFYVRGLGGPTLTLAVAPAFDAALLDNMDIQPREVDAATLAALYAGEADTGWLYGQLESLPMFVHVEAGTVTRAQQQYLP